MTTAHHPDHTSEHEDLAALYALDALDRHEEAAFERHLEGCARCRKLLAEHLGEVAALAEATEPREPPAGARERLLRQVATEPRDSAAAPRPGAAGRSAPPTAVPEPSNDRWSLSPLAAAAAALALLGLGLVVGLVLAPPDAATVEAAAVQAARARSAEERATTLSARLESLESELTHTRAALATASAPAAPQLAGLDPAPEATGRIFVDELDDRALFVARGLPAVDPDRVFQLWAIVDGQPVSAGTFQADSPGVGHLVVADLPTAPVQQWAVTVEPEGGVPAPSGPMVLASETL